MRIRAKEIDIPLDDPFKNDLLDRKDIEPVLSQFISSGTGAFTFAIDAPWGTGKTTFLKMWQVSLNDKGHQCIYFNAWEVDYAIDPLVPIISSISRRIDERKGKTVGVIKKLRKVSSSIARRAIPAAMKLMTMGVLDTKEIVETVTANTMADLTEDAINEYENQRDDIKNFKSLLSALSKEIGSKDTNSKLIIIVDELDRCRPIFAIKLLERIKHLFDVDGIVFVLGMHLAALAHSVKGIYGGEFDASGYLKRFIDFSYGLPTPEIDSYTTHLLNHFEVFDGRRGNTLADGYNVLIPLISSLFRMGEFSLRDQQQYVAKLAVVVRTIALNHNVYEIPLCLMLFVHLYEPNIYSQIKNGSYDFDNLLDRWEDTNNINSSFDPHSRAIMEAYLLNANSEFGIKSKRLHEYQSDKEVNEFESRRRIDVLHIFNAIKSDNFKLIKFFKISINRIELSENFR